jgi:organic radical activating enzyme
MANAEFPSGCFLPLGAISVHPQGHQHFCLTSELPPTKTLSEILPQRLEIHNSLLKGQWPKSCGRCQRKEAGQLQSRRTRTWERKFKIYGRETAAEWVQNRNAAEIRHLDISFSNACNLTCAICSSEFSTQWAKHDAVAESEGLNFRAFTRPYRQLSVVSNEVLAEILDHVDSLDLVIIKGGEPTIQKRCLDFLQALNSRRKRSGLHVFVQSNGTRDPREWVPQLDKLRLEVGFSIDGIGDIFDWIRSANFDRVMQNLKALQDLPQIERLSVDFTLSLYNCFHLQDYFSELLKFKERFSKLDRCSAFQWVQQPYASPLALNLESRLEVMHQIEPLLRENQDFYLNSEHLLKILPLQQLPAPQVQQARAWYDFMARMRGRTIPRYHESIIASLA